MVILGIPRSQISRVDAILPSFAFPGGPVQQLRLSEPDRLAMSHNRGKGSLIAFHCVGQAAPCVFGSTFLTFLFTWCECSLFCFYVRLSMTLNGRFLVICPDQHGFVSVLLASISKTGEKDREAAAGRGAPPLLFVFLLFAFCLNVLFALACRSEHPSPRLMSISSRSLFESVQCIMARWDEVSGGAAGKQSPVLTMCVLQRVATETCPIYVLWRDCRRPSRAATAVASLRPAGPRLRWRCTK